MKKLVTLCLFLLFTFNGNLFSQDTVRILSITKMITESPRPPFPSHQIEVKNGWILVQTKINTLPSDNSEWDTVPHNFKMKKSDYDSLINFALTSSLIFINEDYSKPDKTRGIQAMRSGAGSAYFIISSSRGVQKLPLYDANDYRIPAVVADFNKLFDRISGRYFKISHH